MSDLLTDDEIKSRMKKAPEWELEGDSIVRSIEFDEFLEGIDFVDGVAEIAEEAQHHPDIDIRWCTVNLKLTTHDQGGLTDADFELAQRIDNLLD
ncbi:MAG: 4a-hydroxytetrahydrobiopterin dehydratase [Verrucomicrobiae bacterium]|nr:4a-hydroxytetrahydrobiopterin dehydratase [Verrucomicrobiae bacterium]